MRKLLTIILYLLACQHLLAQMPANLQDSTLNNLVHPNGYRTAKLGELGAVKKTGSGRQSLILIPGIGFSGDIYAGLVVQFQPAYTVYTITPAGFGGTAAPAMPDSSVSYSDMTWTRGIVTGILDLIEREHLQRPTIVASFVTGTQVALIMALEHSNAIGKIVIIGGSPYRYYPSQRGDGTWSDWDHEQKLTPAQRAKTADSFWAPRWFKTVTKQTWDSNMWKPESYSLDSAAGEKFFRESADVPLQVMIRYLLEWMVYDPGEHYSEIKTPTLILTPDFQGLIPAGDSAEASSNPLLYLKYLHQSTWKPATDAGNPHLKFDERPNSRLFMWHDDPAGVFHVIDNFIKGD